MLIRGFEAGQRGALGLRIKRITADSVDDVGRCENLVEILVDQRPGIGIGIIDADLRGSELMLERVVFDPGETQRAGGIEAHCLEIAADDLHRGDAAFFHRDGEPRSRGERRAFAP